jgi:hypothetical protein
MNRAVRLILSRQRGAAALSTEWPSMTSNTEPAGYTMSASSETGAGNAAWKAHDGNVTSGGYWSAVGVPNWVKVQFDTPRKASELKIWPYNSGTGEPHSYVLAGSNDDSAWTTLCTVTSDTSTGPRTHAIGSPDAYLYYRLTVTAITSANIVLFEWDMTLLAA